MKLDDSIIDQFNLEPEDDREPVNVMRVSELLDFLKESATRIVSKSQQYFSTEDADIQAVAELMLNMFQMLLDVRMRQNGKLAVTNICQDHTKETVNSGTTIFTFYSVSKRISGTRKWYKFGTKKSIVLRIIKK